MTQTVKSETFARDLQLGASYVEFSQAPVAYTLEITEAGECFAADYDASGAVRGVEFLSRHHHPIDYYRTLAEQRTKGPGRRGPPRED